MKLEEIVALSVKHNVSDLHLCNSAAPRWRRQGRLEPRPFPRRILRIYSTTGSMPHSYCTGRNTARLTLR